MSKRMIVRLQWYYSEPFTNLISINHEDKELSINKQIKITNKHGSYLFDCATGHFVPRGAIALSHYQRKKIPFKKHIILTTSRRIFLPITIQCHRYLMKNLTSEQKLVVQTMFFRN